MVHLLSGVLVGFRRSSAGIRTIPESHESPTRKLVSASCDFVDLFTWQSLQVSTILRSVRNLIAEFVEMLSIDDIDRHLAGQTHEFAGARVRHYGHA